MPILPPPSQYVPRAVMAEAMLATSAISDMAYLQTKIEMLDRGFTRLLLLITILQQAFRRKARHLQVSPHRQRTSGPANEPPSTPTSVSSSSSSFTFVQREVPASLISNITIAGSLDHLYTTTPSTPSTRTIANVEAKSIRKMVRNGERFFRDTLRLLDTFLCANQQKLGSSAFRSASRMLIECYDNWYNPLIEPHRQVHGVDEEEDRMAYRVALTIQTKTVNPWLYLMVMDFIELNEDMTCIHNELTATERDFSLV